MKSIIFVCLLGGGFYFIDNKLDKNLKTALESAPPKTVTDIFPIDLVSNTAYIYHTRNDEVVSIDPHTIMVKAAEVATTNHCRVLSITPVYGTTFVGAQVICGVFVTFQPIE